MNLRDSHVPFCRVKVTMYQP